ncbi:hypothetical protein [Cellulomonas soli]|uniref:Uncharacterized protein n=1 Tax=Cellulomonas soli TaxID=931535 RepID=A0A512PHW8_9CELL|nr:hypothetical protein [Cellulomonas soli]NYI58823.1 hypothetical protein [Cellulomonas soli]GEP70797.1 hypothetical protein CSO01_35120 [Cellulomonas soli]
MSGTDGPAGSAGPDAPLALTRPSGHARPPWRETAGSGTVLAFVVLAVALTGAGLWICVRCVSAAL